MPLSWGIDFCLVKYFLRVFVTWSSFSSFLFFLVFISLLVRLWCVDNALIKGRKRYPLRACQTEFGAFHCRWKRTTNSESESPSNKAHKNKGDKIGGPACQIKLRPSWPMVYPYILSGLFFVNCHVTQYFASERIVTGKETSWHDVLLLLPWIRQASNTVCWHEAATSRRSAQCCLFTGSCSIILELSC